jgi:CheY-like chemotaxis protein
VDDNASSRRILIETLTHWGMLAEPAAGGPAALAALQQAARDQRPFRLLLTDATMPGMDGFELVEEVGRSPGIAAVRTMMLTSVGRRGDGARCRSLGVGAYLTKPVRQRDLWAAIVATLGSDAFLGAAAPLVTLHSMRERQRHLRILVVEDNPVNQRYTSGLLGKEGHLVLLANNGREALSVLEKETLDLVLMDMQMPEMGGAEAAAIIRKHEYGTPHRIPIIAMTARAANGDRERCLEAGMNAYLPKPFSANALFDLIATLFNGTASTPLSGNGSRVGSEPAFLPRALLEQVNHNRALLCELGRLFVESSPAMLAELHSALARGDAKGVRRTAHRVRGSVANFAASHAMTVAGELERMGETNDLTGAHAALKELESAIDHLIGALSDFESSQSAAADAPSWQDLTPAGGRAFGSDRWNS